MISELRIRDLGVINDAVVEPHPGLTVVTGETGAGKTMIVTGIGLLLGDRADPRAVRVGTARAVVEGRIVVPGSAAQAADGTASVVERVREAGGDLDEDELLVARHITAAGRSRAFLGGAQVPVSVCAEVTTELVAIHGQSEQVRLSASGRQRELLDAYAGPELARALGEYRRRWAEHRAARAELDALVAASAERAREVELLRFGLEQVEQVGPEPAEDVSLAAEATRLQNADDLRLSVGGALAALSGDPDDPGDAGGASALLAAARRSLDHAAADPAVAALATRVAEAAYLLDDVGSDLARYLDDLVADPARLEQVAARRSQLAGLTRAYGPTVDDALAWAANASRRLVELEGGDDRVAELTAALQASEADLRTRAAGLTELRTGAAEGFATAVAAELGALAMPHARLAFAVSPAELGPFGADAVDLLFAANPGSEPRSLGKVASGGELSRVRLALEVVLAADRPGGTLVFDEVEAGVGGRVAVEIGRRLAELARHSQVVVVTHLAQVAAFADRHFVVVKADDGQVTTSGVVQLPEDERRAELARMMAGMETTDSALAHAGELVELAAGARAGAR
ncbi:DNA replication and repair protein RecN [Microlunatus sagamiharensis]|uniref:DNA repair protein RecN n=1 Tax=Microlunatus sagamiharensis TaxID=546874 RepID=A0A1H2LWC9_9ACTN|nr:DNA repair protein RecN [Microlunatus sagamiharensis]SDU85320.1 DNA replication and repair protein RecN [Microlunatus sagamiharensis]